MATINGTADNAADLFDILLSFVRANGWTQVQFNTSSTANEVVKGVLLRGADLAGDGNIYVHLIYRANISTDIYAFELEGSAGYLPGSDVLQFGQNPQNSYKDTGTTSSVIVRVPLHRNPIQYWITGNARRFLGAYRHNDRWGSMYCGFILPYGTPAQWPYPLWIAGNNITTNDYKVVTNGCPWGASSVISGMLYCPSGRWQSTPLSTGPSGGRGYGIQMWPQKLVPAANCITYYYPLKDGSGVEKYVVFSQIFYGANVSEYGTFGEPDGLAYVNSWGASGGDTLTQDAKTWLIVQREMSTANETSAAMLLE